MSSHRHFIIHKPFGFLSQFTSNQHSQRKKLFLGELHDFPDGTMPVGRLDESSEGLLLLTTDGLLSEQIRSNQVEKEYFAQVDGLVDKNALKQLSEGVEIGLRDNKYRTKPCKTSLLEPAPEFAPRVKKIRDDRHGPTSWISICLVEGKFRQVRKMTAAVGYPTLRLFRVRIGHIELNNMAPGEVLEVNSFGFNFRKDSR